MRISYTHILIISTSYFLPTAPARHPTCLPYNPTPFVYILFLYNPLTQTSAAPMFMDVQPFTT